MRTAFDPTPHVKTLEKTLSLLLPLRKQNALKTSELERSVQQSERAYRGDVRGAKAGFETVNSQFQTLDTKITSVGRTAVRIGEQLESIDKLRKRASEAHDLILYYNEFAKGDTSRLEQMRKEGGREGRQKVAVASRRLLSLSKEVDIGEGERGGEGAEKVREGIERYCERFEKDMLKLFDKYYRRGDPKAMAVGDLHSYNLFVPRMLIVKECGAYSTALKLYKISMEVNLAFKSMSINTISSFRKIE